MNKDLLRVLAVFFLLIAVCIAAQLQIRSADRSIGGELEAIGTAVTASGWQEALAAYDTAFAHWQKNTRIWKIIINHDDMRDIEISFVELESRLKEQDRDEALRELSTLLFFLHHVPESQRPEIGNVL